MKFSLPVKLTVFIILLFAVVITTCLLWTPLKVRYYMSKLRSDNPEEMLAGVDGLLAIGERGIVALGKELDGGSEAAEFLAKRWKNINGIELYEIFGPKIVNEVTPLHIAAMKGYKDAASLIIKKGAKVNALEELNNCTPLDLAIENNRHRISDLLRKHGGLTGQEWIKLYHKAGSGKSFKFDDDPTTRYRNEPYDDTVFEE